MPADETEHRFRVIEDEPVDYPVCQPLMGVWKIGCFEQRGETTAPVEPVEPLGVGRGVGEELRLGRLGEGLVDNVGFPFVERGRSSRDFRDLMPPIEKTAPRVVGKAADSLVQPTVVVVESLGI